MKKLYTIAKKEHVVYGHGDMGYELKICRTGAYGQGEYPPVFKSKRRAQKFLASTELLAFTDKDVVELKLED